MALFLAALVPRDVSSCETALLLAMDVSGSVDASEYRLQMEGLAAALRDPAIRDLMIQRQVVVSVLQWSGPGQQSVVLDWQPVRDAAAAEALARQAEDLPRAFSGGGTAIGEALAAAGVQFSRAPFCDYRVLDVSGDGDENAGFGLAFARQPLLRAGVQINGLAIEQYGRAVSSYYRARLISPDGFVETASGYMDFARAIRAKLLRELSPPVG